MAADYDRARDRGDAARGPWLDAIGPYVAARPDRLPVLDVGAGTGIWAAALASRFDVEVVAIEPADGMRRQARQSRPDRRVWSVGGQAEDLPVRSNSAGAAWLSTVVHHLDLVRATAELRRVLVEGAPVLIRSAFPGRHDEIDLFRFFPAAERVSDRFPSGDRVVDAFEGAGFGFVALQRVHEPAGTGFDEWLARLPAMRHTDSTLVALSDGEFAAGLAAVEQAAAAGERPRPIGLDLLVLR